MRRWSFAAVLATGCFSEPPYQPDNAVTFTDKGDGTGAVVAGELGPDKPFSLRFADGDGFRFPDSLRIGSLEMIGRDPAVKCEREDEIGIQLSPAQRISAHTGALKVTNLLAPVLNGPAVVKVKLDWATSFRCSADRSPSGTTTFTVFPDGRIVRFDDFTDPGAPVDGASLCSCGQDDDFTVATFWTFARGSFRDLYDSNLPGQRQQVPDDGNGTNPFNKSCVDDGTNRLTLAWDDSLDSAVRGGPQVITFIKEFLVNNSMLPRLDYKHSSALFIGGLDCLKALERADEHLAPPELQVNTIARVYSERDGIYGGDRGPLGAPGIDLPDGPVTVTGILKSSFAVWLQFPRSVETLRARLPNATGPWYLPQRVTDSSWIVWFRDGLALGQTIEIIPE